MELATYFVLFILTFYTYYVFNMLIHKEKRILEQTKNIEIEKLRIIPAKTLEQQKQFLDLKFSKKSVVKKKFKFSWMLVWVILYTSIIYIFFYKFWEFWFLKYNIELKLWQAIIFVIIFPLLLNMILNKFNLQKNDISIFLRKGHKKK